MARLRVEVQGSNSAILYSESRTFQVPPRYAASPQPRAQWADDNSFAQETRSARRAAICLYKRGGDGGDGSRLAAEQKKLGKRRACGKSTTSAPSA